MLVFIDTEFTDFSPNCDLISIGLITEDGQQQFYAEVSDYKKEWTSPFVKREIFPFLGKDHQCLVTKLQLKSRLIQWFSMLPRSVQIACDSEYDTRLLLTIFGKDIPKNLKLERYDLSSLIQSNVFHQAASDYQQSKGGWHHALHDAKANRLGWLAYMDHSKKLNLAAVKSCFHFE